MQRTWIRRPSPAMAIALLALVFALAGTATAARFIVTSSKQIKPGIIQASNLSKKARKSLRGQRGPQGLQGPKGDKGDAGQTGQQGPPGPFPDPLQSGKTLRGTWALAGPLTNAAGGLAQSPISFGFTFASAPAPHYIPAAPAANPDPTNCPGTLANPQAAAGHLCVYEGSRFNMGQPSLCDPVAAVCGAGVSRFGAFLQGAATNNTVNYFANGTWAATAP